MATLLQDLRFAVRNLKRTPGFTAVVVLTLALGIGANTSIFSIVYGVVLKPLPYAEPAQLVRITSELRGFGAFSVKNRPARTGRNPRTGAHVSVEKKSVPFFKTGKEMRERLNRPTPE